MLFVIHTNLHCVSSWFLCCYLSMCLIYVKLTIGVLTFGVRMLVLLRCYSGCCLSLSVSCCFPLFLPPTPILLQGELVDNIEHHVTTSADAVIIAKDQLIIAEEYKDKARKVIYYQHYHIFPHATNINTRLSYHYLNRSKACFY